VPLDTAVVREFADGLAEVIVVEDKSPLLEARIIEALYPLARRPVVCGKRAPDGSPLLPPTGSLTAEQMMTSSPVAATSKMLAYDALRLMEDRPSQISVLPVIDEGGICVGLLRLHDVVRSGL